MQTIPGSEKTSINDLAWALDGSSHTWRLFTCGLDGLLIEWDLRALKPRLAVPSGGGAAWALCAQPVLSHHTRPSAVPPPPTDAHTRSLQPPASSAPSSSDGSDAEDQSDGVGDHFELLRRSHRAHDDTVEPLNVPLGGDQSHGALQSRESKGPREGAVLALATDDGTVRLLTVQDSSEGSGLAFGKVLCRADARALSLAWSPSGTVVYCGFSDGCVYGMDAATGASCT
jgi:WD40 repeat protein